MKIDPRTIPCPICGHTDVFWDTHLRICAKNLKEAAEALVQPMEIAGNRALAGDGPVPDDLGVLIADSDLRSKFDKAYQRLRQAIH